MKYLTAEEAKEKFDELQCSFGQLIFQDISNPVLHDHYVAKMEAIRRFLGEYEN